MTRPPIPGEPYRIIASQRTRVLDHLQALDDDDRYGRFATSLSDTGIAAYVGRIDFERDIGLAVAAVDEPVIGFVHLAAAAYRLARYVHDSLQKESPEIGSTTALEILDEQRGEIPAFVRLAVHPCRQPPGAGVACGDETEQTGPRRSQTCRPRISRYPARR